MPKITKETLATLANISDELRADLTALFTEIEEKDKSILELRKNQRDEDSDKVVARSKELEKAAGEKDALIADLNKKLAAATKQPEETIELAAFRGFFL